MYVLFFLIIAVGSLAFINLVDGPSAEMEAVEFDLTVEDNETIIEGTAYDVTRIDAFSATLAYTVEDAEQSDTLAAGDVIVIDETEYRVEIPDEAEPDRFSLVETPPEHDLPTFEDDDGNVWVVPEDEDPLLEEEYIEREYGPRDRIELGVGGTFSFDAGEMGVVVTVTVEAITETGVDISWTGPEERTLVLSRNAVTTIGGVDYGVVFVGDDRIQLTTDIDAFEDHLVALDTWEERHQGFWAVGVLAAIAAVLIGGLSYLPRRR